MQHSLHSLAASHSTVVSLPHRNVYTILFYIRWLRLQLNITQYSNRVTFLVTVKISWFHKLLKSKYPLKPFLLDAQVRVVWLCVTSISIFKPCTNSRSYIEISQNRHVDTNMKIRINCTWTKTASVVVLQQIISTYKPFHITGMWLCCYNASQCHRHFSPSTVLKTQVKNFLNNEKHNKIIISVWLPVI